MVGDTVDRQPLTSRFKRRLTARRRGRRHGNEMTSSSYFATRRRHYVAEPDNRANWTEFDVALGLTERSESERLPWLFR